MRYTVYIHTNLINNKRYVGITKRNPPCVRWGNSGSKYSNKSFKEDIEKYGWNNFDHQIVEQNLSSSKASVKEQFWISLFNTTDPRFGYNQTKGGFGCSATNIVGEKISKSKKGKSIKGHFIDAETRAKISASNKNKKRSEETRQKLSLAHKGMKFSTEAKLKMHLSAMKRSAEGKNLGSSGYLWYHDLNKSYFIKPTDERISKLGLIPGRISWKKSS